MKYLDIARLLGAGVKCPTCNSTHCQPSRWQSKHEKLSSVDYRPYRCEDCNDRFLAARGAATERIVINSAAGALLVLGLLTAGDIWMENLDAPKTVHAEPATTLRAEESNAANDPAKQAEKLQKDATDGDVGAMLQLGRDLASGNKLPKDVEQAARWIQLAAATGNPDGMFELGRFYRDGIGVAQDAVRAYVWFSRATAAKHLTAMQERDALVLTMSDEKLQEAQKLSLPAEPLAGTERRKQ